MSLSLRAMRYVSTTMTLGSIAGAAAELHVAASAISAALDQAEAAYGMALVTRVRAKGVFPTSAGRVILLRIDDLLERYDAMLADGIKMQSSFAGQLKIGYYAPVAPAFLPLILSPLMAANPDLSLVLEECSNPGAQAGLVDGSYDAIVFVAETPLPQIEVTPLIHAPCYCLCSSSHPFAERPSVTLPEVAAERLVILDRPVATSYYRELLERVGQTIKVAATANSSEMVRSMVGAGLGCSILNMRPKTALSYAGDLLAAVPIADLSSGLTLSLGVASGPGRRVVQAFGDACIAFFANAKGQELIVAASVDRRKQQTFRD